MRLRALHDGMPPAFTRLWTASAVSSLGDGVYLAALPLLAASLTPNPLALSLVTAAAMLPWLMFGLLGGALVDRWDRRRTMWITDLSRAALLAIPILAVAFNRASLPLLIGVAFLLGCGQIFFDTASSAYLPQLLDRDLTKLRRANTLKQGAQTTANDFAGPPLGSALFVLARAVPLGLDALSFLVSALLIRTLPTQPVPVSSARRSLLADARAGAAYVFGNRVLLGLALRFGVGNLAFAGGEAVLVLFAHQRLHIGDSGYGILLATQAVGGLAGTAFAGVLGSRLNTGHALTVTAAVEAAAQLGLGFSTGLVTAGLSLAVCGAAMSATMVIVPSVSQAIVPPELTGRVSATNRMLGVGAAPVGALLGGWLASVAGLRAPFLVGAVVLVAMTALVALLTGGNRIEEALEAARAERTAERDPESVPA
ncbi:MFS family permease [Kitasatospora sp. MAP12-15]|uniref:MFS transporter n=1 Tax=unclassified Kitasatospora TaxID=2633591 RepID=UPI002474CF7B|nr:MFS transporter [Kitasatospora sp. MAP12-44]MDH6111507.1 MFS family permease [Kitasatospora sp. MAP12-44]